MVRGVNKKVVEIVGQQEDCFERAIVIVKNEDMSLSSAQMRQRASIALTGLVQCRKVYSWQGIALTAMRYLGAATAGFFTCLLLVR